MNSDATSATPYITDVEYVDNYFPHQAPALMNYVAALNGLVGPRLDSEFNYCELGCGRGLTSIALAAMYPQGRFVACDFNEAHVNYATALAEAGRVANLRLLHRSFGAMLKEKLPKFDFITLHGVWSWVPDAVRNEILAFLKAKLKAGGLAMVSYNALPGWAHLQPLRHMMQTYAASLPGDSIERTRKALAYVQHLAKNDATFFTANPAAIEDLQTIARSDIRYVAHEYMTSRNEPFYFQTVCSAMENAGLRFAGNMSLGENYAPFSIRPEFLPLLETAPTRAILETHRDFIANTRFRKDLYSAVAGASNKSVVTLASLEGIAFSLATTPEKLQLRGNSGQIEFDLKAKAPLVRDIFSLLAKGPATARQIHDSVQPQEESEVLSLIQQLVLIQHLRPCPMPRPASSWLPLSSALIQDAVRGRKDQVSLPGSRSGALHAIEVHYALMLDISRTVKDPDVAAKAVLRKLQDAGYVLVHRSSKKAPDGNAKADLDFLSGLVRFAHALRDSTTDEARFIALHGIA